MPSNRCTAIKALAVYRLFKSFLLFALSLYVMLLLAGCGNVYDEHLIGCYCLGAIDTYEQMSVYYCSPTDVEIGRINDNVFSVGWNSRYIVARRHPGNDRSITNYYFLDMTKDSLYADPSVSVTGPLLKEEFMQKQRELGLPGFSRTIESLK